MINYEKMSHDNFHIKLLLRSSGFVKLFFCIESNELDRSPSNTSNSKGMGKSEMPS